MYIYIDRKCGYFYSDICIYTTIFRNSIMFALVYILLEKLLLYLFEFSKFY